MCLTVITLKDQRLAPPTVVEGWDEDCGAGPGVGTSGSQLREFCWAPKLVARLPAPAGGGSGGAGSFVARAGSTKGGAEAGPDRGAHRPRHSAQPPAPRMASPAGSGFPARTNSRLDAFLRRHLAPDVYDAIRAYESCIVVSDSEKHTLKYVVLSDRLIYLTEIPPKSIRRVVALRDVLAIDLVRSAGGQVGSRELPSWAPQSQPSCTREGGGRPSPSLPGLSYSLIYFSISTHLGKPWMAVCTQDNDALPVLTVCTYRSSPIPSNPINSIF